MQLKAALITSLFLLMAAACGAQDTPALDIPSLGSGYDYNQGNYSLGWHFSTSKDVNVTALGFYDDLKDGLKESHKVGIFDLVSKQLLAQTVVLPADPLTGFFRYHQLAAPVTLPGGKEYFVMAVNGSESYGIFVNITVDPSITFLGSAVNYGNVGSGNLDYPDTGTGTNTDNADFGPSFLISNAGAPIVPARTGGAAVDIVSNPTSGTLVNQGAFCMGYRFTPSQDIKVATLGYYDDNKDGFKQSHSVAIFDALTKAVIASTGVATNDPLRGNFRYHAVPGVTLAANNPYFIMGDNSADNYLRDVVITDLTVNPMVVLNGGAFTNAPATLGAEYPTQTDNMPPFFGPTFEILGLDPVTLSKPPTASPAKALTGQLVTFNAVGAGGTVALTYNWSFGDGTSGTGSTVTHAYATAGNYSAIVKISDVVNGSVVSSAAVSVTDPLAFASLPTVSPSPATVGQSVTLSVLAQGGMNTATYIWNFGDNTTAAGSVVSHVYTALGTYSASVTATDSVNPITAAVSVLVNPATVGPAVLLGETDSDGDGFSDAVEKAAGTNPFDPNDRPGSAAPVPAKLTQGKFTVKTSGGKPKLLPERKKAPSTTVSLTGKLDIPAGFSTDGLIVVADIGGYARAFTLDAKGRSKKTDNKDAFAVAIKSKKGQVAAPSAPFKLLLNGVPDTLTSDSPYQIVVGNLVYTK